MDYQCHLRPQAAIGVGASCTRSRHAASISLSILQRTLRIPPLTVGDDVDMDILGGSLGRDTGRQTQRVLESQLDEYGEYWSVRFTPDTILDDLLGQC